MTAQCVAVVTLQSGEQAIAPDATCSQSLVLVDAGTYAAMADNPLLIPMDQAPGLMLATLGLFVAAWSAKVARRALD